MVAVAPALYEPVLHDGAGQFKAGRSSKASMWHAELKITEALRHLKAGSVDRLRDRDANPPGIIVGSKLAEDTGIMLSCEYSM